MTLRPKLALAMTVVALVPMGVALALPMLQAERRARDEASLRLKAVLRQAGILIEREKKDVASRVAQVSSDLARDRPDRQPLWQGAATAGPIALALAERYGLDHLEIRDSRGTLLALSDADPRSDPAVDLSALEEGEVVLRPLPFPSFAADRRVAYFVRRSVARGPGTFTLIGGRIVGRALIEQISEMAGQPVSLVDGSGQVADRAGDGSLSASRLTDDVPLSDGGWRVRLSVPAGDAREERRALLLAFAGTAPLAALSAFFVGLILAGGIARPIRALASRAEATAAEATGGPLSILEDGDEVGRLGLAFNRMLEALSESESQRGAAERIAAWQEVARRIAHEVKNPLSPIRLAVENLRRTRQKAPEEFERSFEEETTTILEEVESLRRLVEEFSLFARLPRPRAIACDLHQLISQTLALFAPRVQAAEVTVDVLNEGFSGSVLADPEQIGRALKNILANSLDALQDLGPERERRLTIALRPLIVTRGGARVRFAEIEIRDTGVGFEPEALRRVFEPYFTTRAGRGGTGLGMAIAYRIVTDHGGRILAGGAPGRGAAVTVRLPIEGPPPAGPGVEGPPAAGLGAARG
ncbi:MAG TPA: ATP-binding protein [Candidatus Polarisedimenticolia bacterium]|nr:ATP-binding protein [Candidatus Polarisedimenticolia bacterium]